MNINSVSKSSSKVTDRITLINELESLLKQCFDTIDNLRSYQHIKENDARLTFFKHLVNGLDSTILFLIVARKYFGTKIGGKKCKENIIFRLDHFLLVENSIIMIR